MRERLAPSAARTATSVCRDDARASSNPATFAQAISNTKATTPCSIHSGCRIHPNSASRIGSTRTPRPLLRVGKSRASWLAMLSISA